jgi:hypothetical protein
MASLWAIKGNGLWNTASNWTPSGVPDGGAGVILDYSLLGVFTSPYSVTISSGHHYSVSSLVMNNGQGAGITLNLSAATLVVSGPFSTAGLANTINETNGSHFIGDTGSFSTLSSLNWTLQGSSTLLFSGQVLGRGVHFQFADGTADKITFGSQGVELFGSISQFGGSNSIDLTHIPYSAALSATLVASLLIISDGDTKAFTFDSFSFLGASVSDLQFADDGSGGTLISVVCFAMGTRIATEGGDIAVEDLREGDHVITLQAGKAVCQPVRWIGRRRLDLRNNPNAWAVAPVRIRAGAFTDGVPLRDLLVSPDHAVLVNGGLIPARQLINHMSICQETDRTSVEYFHIELESHSILLAEGLPVESYLDTGNRGFFGNSSEPVILHPGLPAGQHTISKSAACAEFVTDEASVRPIWQLLHDRAVACGFFQGPDTTTREADLRVVTGGREFLPVTTDAGRYIFALPAGSGSARLVSRSAASTGASPWLNDRRLLGVAIERIGLHTTNGMQELPLDHPLLSHGWWDAERSGTSLRRWTDGDAMIPLPGGPILLEVVVAATSTYSLADAQLRRAA